ncbi:hypothetical protein Tco_1171767 [Tanacetum coccineum]
MHLPSRLIDPLCALVRLETFRTLPTPRFEVGESFVAAAARQPGSTMVRRVDYSFVDIVDASIRDTKRRTMAAIEDAQTDRAAVRAEIEVLRRERLAYERERERE